MQSGANALGAWVKSSYSDVRCCVEVGAAEVSTGVEVIQVRDSKDPGGPVLSFTRDEMRAFVAGAKDGEFDDYT